MTENESIQVHAICIRLEQQKNGGAAQLTLSQDEVDLLRRSFGEFYSGPTMYLGLPVVAG